MRRSALAILGVLLAAWASGQDCDLDIHTQTSPPAAARFQIVQSTITMRDTYRLDRHSGRVHRLVVARSDELLWEEMVVRSRPVVLATAPRFQIFLSGTAARGSYLIDTQTGRTWQVVESRLDPDGPDSEENNITVWTPLHEVDLD